MVRTVLILVLAGCASPSSNMDAEAYPTFQGCWDEHHLTESFSVRKAIEVCCIDHPIGTAAANTVCGDTASSCETYVGAGLTSSSATADDINAACSAYVVDRGG
jgi:hypothetical protein